MRSLVYRVHQDSLVAEAVLAAAVGALPGYTVAGHAPDVLVHARLAYPEAAAAGPAEGSCRTAAMTGLVPGPAPLSAIFFFTHGCRHDPHDFPCGVKKGVSDFTISNFLDFVVRIRTTAATTRRPTAVAGSFSHACTARRLRPPAMAARHRSQRVVACNRHENLGQEKTHVNYHRKNRRAPSRG